MALNIMLRRATSTVFPLGIRTVGFPRTIPSLASSRTIQTGVERASFSRSSIGSYRQFSLKRSNNKNLIRLLNSEIECADEPTEVDFPHGFPFEIHDSDGRSGISLTRTFKNEDIKVEVVEVFNSDDDDDEDDEGDDDERDDDDDDEDDDDDDHDGEAGEILMNVIVSKGGDGSTGMSLQLDVAASPIEITIDNVSVTDNEDCSSYGLAFSEFDEMLKKTIHKYLEIRGIKPDTIKNLLEYMENKGKEQKLCFFKKFKKFVAK